MTLRVGLFSEPYSRHGGFGGTAVTKSLGQSQLPKWEIFVREAIQNSWDARSTPAGPISFGIDTFSLSRAQKEYLSEGLLVETQKTASLQNLTRALSAVEPLEMLVVWDSGTKGLGGLTDPSRAPKPGQPTDFADFIFNIGQPEDHAIGGGTFGFGKAVFYRASQMGTCVIYSQTLVDGEIENRLIAVSVQPPFTSKALRFTGRHWWGVSDSAGEVAPIVGEESRQLAETLGLVRFPAGSTGTVIAVLSPDWSADDEVKSFGGLALRLREAAIKWAWPHMVAAPSSTPTIDFSFSHEGSLLSTPDVSNHEAVGPFVSLYMDWLTGTYSRELGLRQEKTIHVGQGRGRHMGTLSFVRIPQMTTKKSSQLADSKVALMRAPRLIVQYLEVPNSNEIEQYGVFVAAEDSEVERLFAEAEPPTHDKWEGDEVGVSIGRPVRSALAKITEVFRPVKSPHEFALLDEDLGNQTSGLERVSLMLGRAIAGSGGLGAGRRVRRDASPRLPRDSSPRATLESVGELVLVGEEIVSSFLVRVVAAGPSESVGLHADVKILSESGNEDLTTLEVAERPRPLGWFHEEGEQVSQNDRVDVPNRDAIYIFKVGQRPDMPVTIVVGCDAS
jgi:hypothetical protein